MYMHVHVVTASRQQMYTLEHLFLMFFNFKLAFQEMSHTTSRPALLGSFNACTYKNVRHGVHCVQCMC